MNTKDCSPIVFVGASSFLLQVPQNGTERRIRARVEAASKIEWEDTGGLCCRQQPNLPEHLGKGKEVPNHRQGRGPIGPAGYSTADATYLLKNVMSLTELFSLVRDELSANRVDEQGRIVEP